MFFAESLCSLGQVCSLRADFGLTIQVTGTFKKDKPLHLMIDNSEEAEIKRLIRLDKCERAIRRICSAGASLPHHERHPFRDPIEDVLVKSLCRQKRWVTRLTEE